MSPVTQEMLDAMHEINRLWTHADVCFRRSVLGEIEAYLIGVADATEVHRREEEVYRRQEMVRLARLSLMGGILTPEERAMIGVEHVGKSESALESAHFLDRFLAANQNTIDQIVAMSESDPKGEAPRSPFVMPSWTGPHPELRDRFSGSITVPGKATTTIKVEAFDVDGTPVTYIGEVTKTEGHADRTVIPWPEEDDEEDDVTVAAGPALPSRPLTLAEAVVLADAALVKAEEERRQSRLANSDVMSSDAGDTNTAKSKPRQLDAYRETSSPADWRDEFAPPTVAECYGDMDQ